MNLLGTGNSKTIKGEKRGWTTYVMYLSPYKQNSKGVNLCAKASKGCAEACLFTAGRGAMKRIQDARRNKTELFLNKKEEFMSQLVCEILLLTKKHEKNNSKFCIRLNGTSDIPFENIKFQDGTNIFESFPNVQFYDYTKIRSRMKATENIPNYHLTFSRSESNNLESSGVLLDGYNVAVVFNNIPETWNGYKVINGDEDDLRFLDPKGVIVGLKAKGKARQDRSGFVIR